MNNNKMLNIKKRLGHYQFNTIVSVANEDIFDFSKIKIIRRIDSTKNFFSKKPVVIVADPFLFKYKDELFLFYEEQKDLKGKGIIKMSKTSDLSTWTEPIVVLEENFHLSYPNVFEIDNQIYMMPETGQDKSIKLYTPNYNLTEWIYYKTLLDGKHFLDSSIIKKGDDYFLFTTERLDNNYLLRLYFSSSIDEQWEEHPQSPIAKNANTARCGGALFYNNSRLFRPSQRTSTYYGEGLDIYEVLELNRFNYKEIIHKNVFPNNVKEYNLGGHHFNVSDWNNKKVIATDSLELRLNFWEIIRRLKNKIFDL